MKFSERGTTFSALLKQDYDYEHAVKIRKRTIYTVTVLAFVFLLIEWLVDLETSTTPLLVSLFSLNLLLSLLVTKTSNTYLMGHFQVALIYFSLQAHIFYSPTYFHTMVFWMPLVPMLSVFLISVRASYIWLTITILSVGLNAWYGTQVVGESYIANPRFIAFGTGGSVFVFTFYLTFAYMYRILGNYYLDLQLKKEEVAKLNEQLNSLNANLEKKVLEKVSDIQEQNKRLEKYAFMNAHIVRAPLANIMGALNLYHETEDPSKKMELLKMLDESANMLDSAVREVAEDLRYHSN